MRSLLEGWLNVRKYPDPLDQTRARLTIIIALALLLTTVPTALVAPNATSLTTLLPNVQPQLSVLVVNVGLTLMCVTLIHRGRLEMASRLLVSVGFFLYPLAYTLSGFYLMEEALASAALLMLCALLLGPRGLLVGSGVLAMMVVIGVLRRTVVPPLPPLALEISLFNMGFALATLVGLLFALLRIGVLSQRQAASSGMAERLKLASVGSEIAQHVARRESLETMLADAVDAICERYPLIYHAQIFLIDEASQMARLSASTGAVGKMLLARQHSLGVGSKSVIGTVTGFNQAVVARADERGGVHRRNEFLPDTVVEAAFPLRLEGRVIGALDLQSKDSQSFAEDEVPVFQSLADYLAVAIDNARLVEETRASLKENQRLVERMRQSAQEVERLNRRLTGEAWQNYSREQVSAGVHVEMGGQALVRLDPAWTPALRRAVEDNQLVRPSADDNGLVAVPLRVRGQVIGAMEFDLGPDGALLPEDLEMLEQVAEQFGLVAESNRLFETSQRLAQREALVNEISSKLNTSTDVETTLQTAARSLQETLNARRVSIRLGQPRSEQKGEGA